MRFLFLFFILIFTFLFHSCTKNNTNPAWIEINKWELQSNGSNSEGELTQNFSSAYILIDNKIIGYFELPVKLPILTYGNQKIDIYPAINNNGISATKKVYPFCESYSLTTTLEENKTITISPKTKYTSKTKFWIENFEDAGIKIITDPNYPYIFSTGNDPEISKYGQRYGQIKLSKIDSSWYGYTNGKLNLPKNGAEVYLEIDYINSNSILTGIQSVSLINGLKNNPNIQLNRQNETNLQWKKIYIDLKEIVSSSINADYFEVYFQAILDANLESSFIYLDNIKIVYQ